MVTIIEKFVNEAINGPDYCCINITELGSLIYSLLPKLDIPDTIAYYNLINNFRGICPKCGRTYNGQELNSVAFDQEAIKNGGIVESISPAPIKSRIVFKGHCGWCKSKKLVITWRVKDDSRSHTLNQLKQLGVDTTKWE